MSEITLAGNDYSIGSFTGEQQGQIIRRLAPHLTAMPKLLEKYRRQAVALQARVVNGNGETPVSADIDDDFLADGIASFLDAFGDLPDDKERFIRELCFSVVKRKQGAAGWIPIYSAGVGRSSFEDIHVSYALQLRIASAVLWENLQNFFFECMQLWVPASTAQAGQSTSSADSLPSPATRDGFFVQPDTPGTFAGSPRSATGR
jgi:hypothetical protein